MASSKNFTSISFASIFFIGKVCDHVEKCYARKIHLRNLRHMYAKFREKRFKTNKLKTIGNSTDITRNHNVTKQWQEWSTINDRPWMGNCNLLL